MRRHQTEKLNFKNEKAAINVLRAGNSNNQNGKTFRTINSCSKCVTMTWLPISAVEFHSNAFQRDVTPLLNYGNSLVMNRSLTQQIWTVNSLNYLSIGTFVQRVIPKCWFRNNSLDIRLKCTDRIIVRLWSAQTDE